MSHPFTKLEALGNDFILIDTTTAPTKVDSARIRELADRHKGIGFDQALILSKTAQETTYQLRIANSDGSLATQCGNGLRAIGAYLKNKHPTESTWQITIDDHTYCVTANNDNTFSADLGVPSHAPASIPFLADSQHNTYPIELADNTVTISVVNVGNPHAIILTNHIDPSKYHSIAKQLQASPRFPDGANVGFLTLIDKTTARLQVYERGAGKTLACGSGAAAAHVAGFLLEKLGQTSTILQPGGALKIHWKGNGAPVTLCGLANRVFDGEYYGKSLIVK